MPVYKTHFYDAQSRGSWQSAREVIPLVLEYIQPETVIDVGCGIGTWLSVLKDQGIDDYWGVDGDYVDPHLLLIPEERFLRHDLSEPFFMDREFDLVISLEVAEHIPPDCADVLVNSLVKLGPVVLFSAAIPFQGGTHHVNEQWPEYWVEKFQHCGYVVIDCLRRRLWQKADVDPWYAQNIFLVVNKDRLGSYPLLKDEFEQGCNLPLSLVHPKMWTLVHEPRSKKLIRSLSFLLPPALRSSLKRGAGRLLGGQ